ncbi:hypothetical protein [uncultured Jatrophihabitans sp.]|uniref:hypothetical protein n=1 Tax=uncultured Jatrophihabitans sp. TaxID=1610747 RepID=UPI0035CB7E85
MACCGRTSTGNAIVFQLHVPGEEVRTFATKTDAEIARTKAGGRGTIIRTTQPSR